MDLSKHLEKAADAVKRRNYKLATQICSQLLGLQPDNGEARKMLRTALFKKVEKKPASKAVAWVAGGIHVLTGSVAGLLGQHAAAAKAFERFLLLDPLNEGINLRLGDALERAGFLSSALAVYQAYAEAQPRCLVASRRAGGLFYEAGEVDDALRMYEQALKIDPRDQESLKARKNLAAEGALRSSGIAEAKSSRDLIKDAEAQRRLERADRIQLSADELDSELTEAEEAMAADPDNVDLLVRVADLRVMAKDLQGALDLYDRAVQVAPERSDLAAKAGELRIRLQQDRVAEAKQRGDDAAAEAASGVLLELRLGEHRRRVAQHPTDFGLRYDLGQALFEAGELDEAIKELQQAIKDPRKKVEALWCLGRAFRAKGLGDLAMGQLQKALDASGGVGHHAKDIIYEMGSVAEELGHADDALAHFSRILEQDIGYRDVAQRVEQLKSSKSS